MPCSLFMSVLEEHFHSQFLVGKFLIMQKLHIFTAFQSGYCLATVKCAELSF
jgi:hypothetical protein